ncbi:MAG: metal-dependent hydrolase [Promethearchaeota archaeon]
MYPIFHIAVPLILTEIPRIKKYKINRFSLIIGALLPDIIDKPLFLLSLADGRLFSHNLLFVIVSFLIVHIFTKGNKTVSLPFLIGLSSHIILDLPFVPLFYPFISYNFYYIEEPLNYWLRKLWTDPLVISTEITGIFFIIFIITYNKLYHFSDITNYLKGTSQNIIQISKEINKSA